MAESVINNRENEFDGDFSSYLFFRGREKKLVSKESTSFYKKPDFQMNRMKRYVTRMLTTRGFNRKFKLTKPKEYFYEVEAEDIVHDSLLVLYERYPGLEKTDESGNKVALSDSDITNILRRIFSIKVKEFIRNSAKETKRNFNFDDIFLESKLFDSSRFSSGEDTLTEKEIFKREILEKITNFESVPITGGPKETKAREQKEIFGLTEIERKLLKIIITNPGMEYKDWLKMLNVDLYRQDKAVITQVNFRIILYRIRRKFINAFSFQKQVKEMQKRQ